MDTAAIIITVPIIHTDGRIRLSTTVVMPIVTDRIIRTLPLDIPIRTANQLMRTHVIRTTKTVVRHTLTQPTTGRRAEIITIGAGKTEPLKS